MGPEVVSKKNENKLNRLLFEEAAYFEACYFLKSKKVPKNWPEIKNAEALYKKGEMQEANTILYNFWTEIEALESIDKRDIKYFGN